MSFQVPERFRVRTGVMASNSAYGNNGAFTIVLRDAVTASVIASDQMGWEHVSVSRQDRCLTWEQMCQVKDMFWGEDDCVVQYHPPKQAYVNNHPYCLHLWRVIGIAMPMPPSMLVGIKG